MLFCRTQKRAPEPGPTECIRVGRLRPQQNVWPHSPALTHSVLAASWSANPPQTSCLSAPRTSAACRCGGGSPAEVPAHRAPCSCWTEAHPRATLTPSFLGGRQVWGRAGTGQSLPPPAGLPESRNRSGAGENRAGRAPPAKASLLRSWSIPFSMVAVPQDFLKPTSRIRHSAAASPGVLW